jgi:hypothetical protein
MHRAVVGAGYHLEDGLMKPQMRRSASVIGLLVSLIAVVGAAQATKFPVGTIKGGDGTNNYALQFDSTGALNVYVNDQMFSTGRYVTRADTITFGPHEAPEGYGCAGDGTYLWKLTENRMSFTTVKDGCQIRITTLTAVAWTRG